MKLTLYFRGLSMVDLYACGTGFSEQSFRNWPAFGKPEEEGSMKLAMCLAAWGLMFVSTAAAQEAASAGASERAREQAMNNVKRALGSLREGQFVVALGEATLPQAGAVGGGKGEGGARPKGGEGGARAGGEGGRAAQPQVSWQFQVIEGRDAAASAIVQHMSGGTPTSPRNWRFVQRFKADEQEKAAAAVAQLQQQQQPAREGGARGKGEAK
jgi:hypothetical protein